MKDESSRAGKASAPVLRQTRTQAKVVDGRGLNGQLESTRTDYWH